MEKSNNTELIVSGILLAAGSSKRLGYPKQLLEWNDQYLINYIIYEILKSRINELFVVLGDHYQDLSKIIDQRVKIVYNSNWAEGKSSSIKTGVAHLGESTIGAMFFVVDQPFINYKIIDTLIQEFKKSPDFIIAPRIKRRICNPVLFSRRFFDDLNDLSGEEGGKVIINKSKKVKWVD
ncbi:MAG: nucleotidyltransferase family protein, partial [Pelolinea sp.]|nr:nucleotidyltransferase family protein [Pelolinea sp.]